ncbi:DUF4118 domain-containing protein [Massilia sp. CF038]|uniref:DUF4118 domain-containing protein n=1 Tax=Massilia sp. CF038 TaxID=1881045 RepID=UPI000918CEA0|nr:DUF4118 domain-containing protein [Massilia sp. CF038]SHH19844.1 two-component system, OmpR family, sensor histidine kinase KdpD [Massilia sp. CF038]
MLAPEGKRPDPDALLAQMEAQQRLAGRGRLRVYFGASAGVGKTYAMLAAARKLHADGVFVLAGVVETHGRSETAALLDGLPQLPLRPVAYRGKTLSEFDLDAALARQPALILMDELAHTNAPGSRHPKRWQDVEELLERGIDVFTTVNVQHLDSLNDVVGGITGIRVAETVPDTVFDGAAEVVLVDLPADELLARLKSGKVYQPQQAAHASLHFFRKGNLIALRELALRRTADRIEDDVRAYRVEQSIDTLWKTGAALLALVGPRTDCEHVVRNTARLASQLGTGWHAIYIETPALQRLPAARREQILRTLKLAQDLGASTAVLAANDIAQAAIDYARSHNLSRITMGRGHRTWPWRHPHIRALALHAPDIDLIEFGDAAYSTATGKPGAPGLGEQFNRSNHRHRWAYLWAAVASVATALMTTPLQPYLDLPNIAMLFLLVVVLVAVRFGRGPSVLATCLCVASFDFFFVSPRFSFAVSDVQYIVTFGVMLVVGLITGHLTAGLRFQARVAAQRERRARALYEFARELSGALQTEQIVDTTRNVVGSAFRARLTLLVPDAHGRLHQPSTSVVSGPGAPIVPDLGIAQWAFERAEAAGLGTDTLPASRIYYLPLVAPMRTRGVLAIEPETRHWILIPEQRQQLDTFAALAAIALERVHYIEVAQGALVNMESERLRNSLLAALSHDLRTPLTSLVGLSESLAASQPPLTAPQLDLAHSLHDESLRMSALVANLLDMARIQSGQIQFKLQWQALEEVVGTALRISAGALAGHHVRTHLPPDLPLLQFDATLFERVLCNLLENAAKYTPPGSTISIAVGLSSTMATVTVSDDGPGLPPGDPDALFEKFARGERESAKPGVGLGLAICRAIVDAHGGRIEAQRLPQGGAAFIVALPLGTPPVIPELEHTRMDPADE